MNKHAGKRKQSENYTNSPVVKVRVGSGVKTYGEAWNNSKDVSDSQHYSGKSMEAPEIDPKIAERDAYGNVTVKESPCKHCPANGTRHCPLTAVEREAGKHCGM